ncbi:hypothetical protein DMN91_003181 [Ooceraea biroi]|uniref:Uncharacterized protein n=1 Tax=Ooceraea biroi TaxID=2015173 RepID=A0A3L8DYR3_OOCBI|nr:hypothetical protein DMN91_003181 [Ooceraea biroi]
MRFVRQPLTIRVTNCDDRLRQMGDNEAIRKHGLVLPTTIRAIIYGPSNCGKTNVLISLLESPHGVRFENVYVDSKSLQQPKYQYLENLLTSIDEIGYFTFSNNSDAILPCEARPNSIFVFDDVACDKQDTMREYFSMGRHSNVDSFYLCQTYARIPKHLICYVQSSGELEGRTQQNASHTLWRVGPKARVGLTTCSGFKVNDHGGRFYRRPWNGLSVGPFLEEKKPRLRKVKELEKITLDNKDDKDEANTNKEEESTKLQPPKKVPKQDPKLVMLKEAFGVLKSVSSSSNDEIKSFLSFIENKMKRYNEHTKNIVQQAICEIVFKADNGYYENYFGNYYPHGTYNAQPTHAAPMPQSNRSIPNSQPTYVSPISQSNQSIPMSQPSPLIYQSNSQASPNFAAHPMCSSSEMPISPDTPTPPLTSPSQHSSCSEASNDYNFNEYI